MSNYLCHSGTVLAGRYQNKYIFVDRNENVCIELYNDYKKDIVHVHYIDKKNILKYEVISKEEKTSTLSAYKKSVLGGLIFGNAGSIAGASTADKNSIYKLAIYYHNGEKSLIQVDSYIFALIEKNMF